MQGKYLLQDRTFNSLLKSSSERELEKAAKEVSEVLKIVEEEGLGHNNNFFGGETMNMVDIAYGWLAHWFECIEEVVGVKLLNPMTFPRLCAWIENFKQVPVIKENLPDRIKLMAFLESKREMSISYRTKNK
ncbi:S-crystallin [Trema orientale]|uniref:Glutathione S-transferase n=1 Tax=Trema orientale TaxID=63057 RepID=A0A2P5FAU1_TREOI|nr:S-crystallin [Trema orientale]